MDFKSIAKLAVIRSKIIEMKLHSSLVNIKWNIISKDICPYMRIGNDKDGSPIIEVSDAVLEDYDINTIVIIFMHEFSHKIFKHLEKAEMRFKTAEGNLLTMYEYNIIMDYVIDDFLLHNTFGVNINPDIKCVFFAHIKCVSTYYYDLYKTFIKMYDSIVDMQDDTFKKDLQFKTFYYYVTQLVIYDNRRLHKSYTISDGVIHPTVETFDNIVDTVILIKNMIIKMREHIENKQAQSVESKSDEKSNDLSNEDVEPSDEKQVGNSDEKSNVGSDSSNKTDEDVSEDSLGGKQQQSIIDPSLKPKTSKSNVTPNKDYQKEALENIIDENYASHYSNDDRTKEVKERTEKLLDMQKQFSDSVQNTNLDKLPDVMHDDSQVINSLFNDELQQHRDKHFNKVLSKIYSRVNSYGDNSTKMDYVWKNPRALMYLQDDYIIQDIKELEKSGKKKIAVYVDSSGSMGRGPAKTVNSILQTFSKDLIDVDIWFWDDKIRYHRNTYKIEPYKIEELDVYPSSGGNTALHKVYEHAYNYYKDESELTVIIISDFDDMHELSVYNNKCNPNNNKHWQYLNVHIVTEEYEKTNKFERFKSLNALLGVDNPMITTQILNF